MDTRREAPLATALQPVIDASPEAIFLMSPDGCVLAANEAMGRRMRMSAGEMVGSLYYERYPGGAGLTSGAVFGRIAGARAAAYALQQA